MEKEETVGRDEHEINNISNNIIIYLIEVI